MDSEFILRNHFLNWCQSQYPTLGLQVLSLEGGDLADLNDRSFKSVRFLDSDNQKSPTIC